MDPKEYSLLKDVPDNIRRLLINATNHAKNVIKESGTSLKNLEGLDRKNRSAVKAKQKEIDELDEKVDKVREKLNEELKSRLLGDAVLNRHTTEMKMVKQHQVGNCGEYSSAVVDYIATHGIEDNVRAEIVEIKGGNHVVAVIQRDPGSDPKDPSTWGKDAIIVDAWADNIYPASQYLEHLKALALDKDNLGMSEDFNHNKHEIFIYPFYNTETLRSQEFEFNSLAEKYRIKLSRLIAICRLAEREIQEMIKLANKEPNKQSNKKQISELEGKLRKIEIYEKQILHELKLATNETLLSQTKKALQTENPSTEKAAELLSKKIHALTKMAKTNLKFSKKHEAALFNKSPLSILKSKSGLEKKIIELNSKIDKNISQTLYTYDPYMESNFSIKLDKLQLALMKKIMDYDKDYKALAGSIAPDKYEQDAIIKSAKTYVKERYNIPIQSFKTRKEFEQEVKLIKKLSSGVELAHVRVLNERKKLGMKSSLKQSSLSNSKLFKKSGADTREKAENANIPGPDPSRHNK